MLHRKSAGPGHVDLDFALPSVQLAVRLLAEREFKQFPSRAEAAQRLQGRGRICHRGLAGRSNRHASFSIPGNSELGGAAGHHVNRDWISNRARDRMGF